MTRDVHCQSAAKVVPTAVYTFPHRLRLSFSNSLDGRGQRRQRPGAAKDLRAGDLQDRLDLAPQAASCDGPAWPRSTVGSDRGGRNVFGRLGGGSARPTDGGQVFDRDRGPRRWAGHRADPHEANFRMRSAKSLMDFVEEAIELASSVYTDGSALA
jgi:hypothetical protein